MTKTNGLDYCVWFQRTAIENWRTCKISDCGNVLVELKIITFSLFDVLKTSLNKFKYLEIFDMPNQNKEILNEQWIMFVLGPFFHFPYFIGIAMPLVMGLTSRHSHFSPGPSYLAGWFANIVAAWFYYYHGWF